jgi:hypothetical protein
VAADNFDSMVRSLRLYVPQLPYTLCQQIVRDRYRRVLERRDWSGLRGEFEFILNPLKTGAAGNTVTATLNSPTIVGAGTAFASTDVGRQFKLGQGSIYSILAVNVGGQTLTLDRNYSLATIASSVYTIFDGYVNAPSDFKTWMTAVDRLMGWRLRTWITQDELNMWDPQRTFFGNPYVLADRRYFTDINGVTTYQFEAWPYNSAQRAIHCFYFKLGSDLIQDTDLPIYPIRSDALVSGALADVARWPGTPERPNPYFGKMALYTSYEAEYEDKFIEIERADENIYMNWLETANFSSLPFAPFSANYMFSHAL